MPIIQGLLIVVKCVQKCQQFKKMTSEAKGNVVRNHNLCFNCLMPGHRVMHCEANVRCRQCGRKHNTILHVEDMEHSAQA